jgi:hypothetical protein
MEVDTCPHVKDQNFSIAVGSFARNFFIVVTVSASRTEDPGFEYRQGVRFLGL